MKKNLIVIFSLLCLSLLITSCNSAFNDNDVSASSYETVYSEESSVVEYRVFPINTDLTFDTILDSWSNYLGVYVDSFTNESSSEGTASEALRVRYYQDFQLYLPDLYYEDTSYETLFGPSFRYDPWFFLRGTETDYHITRYLRINNLRVYEFEDEGWAETAYREAVDNAVIRHSETLDSDLSNGYCFVYGRPSHNFRRFFSTYLFGNCVISYYCAEYDNDGYSLYCDLCDYVSLPTSEVATEIVNSNAVKYIDN